MYITAVIQVPTVFPVFKDDKVFESWLSISWGYKTWPHILIVNHDWAFFEVTRHDKTKHDRAYLDVTKHDKTQIMTGHI